MIEDPWKYLGVDWLAMVLTFVAIWQIGNRDRIGFVVMVAGNACWIALGVMTDSLAMVVANAAFALMNFRALAKWGKEVAATEAT